MTNTNSSTSVYVETDSLTGWSGEMNTINKSAVTVLENIESTIKELDDYWIGDSATGFKNATTALIIKAKNCHEKMKDVSSFLNQVVTTMENE